MKLLHFVLSALLLGHLAAAQATGPEEGAGDVRAKSLEVVTEPRQLATDFSSQEMDCYKRFAVNRCLDSISVQRRNAMAILEREENLLKDAARKARGAQQIHRSREKSLPDQSRGGVEPKTVPKHPQQRSAAASEAEARHAFEERLSAQRKKAQARIDREAGSAEKSREFQTRQDESVNRRLQHEARQAERNHAPSNPLPLPP